MHLIPLGLGLIAVLIGIGMVGFGIPINEFGLGNTLIAAGTTAIVGGFVLLGLWAAVVQLRRLGNVIEPRRAGLRESPASDAVRTRHRPRPAHPVEAHAETHEPSFAAEEAFEGNASRPEPPPGLAHGGAPARPAVRGEEEASALDMYAPHRSPARERSFDAIWPSERRPPSPAEPARPSDDRRPPAAAPAPGGAQAAAILKSGVINGMAYTLYTDGSIEAELAQGMVRFGSIEELRAYLADQG